jgi:hypothetical protein
VVVVAHTVPVVRRDSVVLAAVETVAKMALPRNQAQLIPVVVVVVLELS